MHNGVTKPGIILTPLPIAALPFSTVIRPIINGWRDNQFSATFSGVASIEVR
jgi:hypothetical protein